MGIEATTSAMSGTTSAPQVSSSSSSSKTNSSDASFKDEMSKVSESEQKKDSKTNDKDLKEVKDAKKSDSKEDKKLTDTKNETSKSDLQLKNDNIDNTQNILLNAQLTLNDANTMLANNIQQMIENTSSITGLNKNWVFSFGDDTKSSIKMNESDADFFINLTQNENVNVQSIQAQAQGMLNNGAEVAEVKQNVQVSQVLLDALSQARETNQPLRIDFDQNISVILRVGRDGALSAQFIPGDKAVEQYLKNNIESLKSSFEEQDLPYSELSYSHSSKDQNQRRRQEKQQGE